MILFELLFKIYVKIVFMINLYDKEKKEKKWKDEISMEEKKKERKIEMWDLLITHQ